MLVAAFARFYGMTPVAVLAMGTVLWLELLDRMGRLERAEAAMRLRLATAARWLKPGEGAVEELLAELAGEPEGMTEAQAAAQGRVDAALRKAGWR